MIIPKGSGCQHSAFTVITSEEQCSKFSFIIARCSQKELPYTFHEREKSFNPQTVRCHQAKVMQLVGETSPEDTELCYSSTNQMSSTLTMAYTTSLWWSTIMNCFLRYSTSVVMYASSQAACTVFSTSGRSIMATQRISRLTTGI